MAQSVSRRSVMGRTGFDARSVFLWFIVYQVAVGHVSPEYLCLACLSVAFHRCTIFLVFICMLQRRSGGELTATWLRTVGRPVAVQLVISCGTSQQTNEPTCSSLVSRSTRLHFGDLTCKFTHSWSIRKSIQQNSYWPSVIAEFNLEKMTEGKSQCKGWPNIWFVRKQAESVLSKVTKSWTMYEF
jgi:hypothetical protein